MAFECLLSERLMYTWSSAQDRPLRESFLKSLKSLFSVIGLVSFFALFVPSSLLLALHLFLQWDSLRAERSVLPHYVQLDRYSQADRTVVPGSTVFLGDSITDLWHLDAYFPGKNYVNRGIAGQTTAQMLLRFRQDVIDLHPSSVIILGGVNDLSLRIDVAVIKADYQSMADLAKAHSIRPIFGTILPLDENSKHPVAKLKPNATILELNQWLRSWCGSNGFTVIDYAGAVTSPSGNLRSDFTMDGLHPNDAGYRAMAGTLSKTLQASASHADN